MLLSKILTLTTLCLSLPSFWEHQVCVAQSEWGLELNYYICDLIFQV